MNYEQLLASFGPRSTFKEFDMPVTSASTKPMTIFWLVKATPAWLALPPKGAGGRFAFVESTLKPIVGKHPGAQLRFFDAEAYTSVCSDVMMWQVTQRADYEALVEDLRETPFWDHYFQVQHIVPAVEDGYAEHYEQERVQ
jgi:hypothetical protein